MLDHLVVDKVYSGGRRGNASDDPLPRLVGVSNQGGFRIWGSKASPSLIVLVTALGNPDWPDKIDLATGAFIYYGDNKQPGRELHDTPRYGNWLLREMFEKAHGDTTERAKVPPVLVFAKDGQYRDMKFLGLAVPGGDGIPFTDDLVAVWKSANGKRFQNYRALFTILDVPAVSTEWIAAIRTGRPAAKEAPDAWLEWIKSRRYRALKSGRTIEHRSREEQLPQSKRHQEILRIIREKFKKAPNQFESCAAAIAHLELGAIVELTITPPTRDGGRDAFGKLRIGGETSGIEIDFALEAKCYQEDSSVGVKELSRLISRLRHRQFGILITTSFVANQAYKEIKEDGHPVVIISAADIARILDRSGYGQPSELVTWLDQF